MWTTFWINNLHFALEFFGAIVIFVLAWLALDAYLIRREFKTLARCLGFSLFAFWLIVNALDIANDLILFFAVFCYLTGLLLILLNLHWEKAPPRPEFKAVLIIPAATIVLWWFHIPATILLVAIAFLAFGRYRAESLKTLKPFFWAFLLLAFASILAIFDTKTGDRGTIFIIEHILKLAGFCLLGYWGWQYLKIRIKEELLLIFVGMALFIAMIVTFTFSAILLQNIEKEAKVNLTSSVRVLDYSFSRMKSEALSNAQIFAQNASIAKAVENKDFEKLGESAKKLMEEKSMAFLTIADQTGEVLVRAHSLTSRGDSISSEKAGSEALTGNLYATVESTPAESFSIRGAAPVYNEKGNIIGAVLTGFIIDNTFSDQIKKVTGLEVTIYQKDTVQATTIFDSEGKTRNVGAKQTDQEVLKLVLEDGKSIAQSTNIFSRPYLAAYLPLKNTEGEIIGMYQASRPQIQIAQTAASTNRLALIITIIIALMASLPIYFVVKKITEEA